MTRLTYEQAVDWIHAQLKFGMKPGIERMRWLLEQFGNPQEQLKAVHVVGTNGKGSTVNYLQTIFSLAGYQVGTFTSPYLMDFRERISLNGQMILQDHLLALVELVKPVVERLPLETPYEPATEFEIITLIMLIYFSRYQPVDIAFIEAGLGGKHDSTNVFQALAVVCPSIGLDHQDILGQTYAEIAAEKVAVLKQAEPLIFASQRQEVSAIFRDRARAVQSPVFELGEEFQLLHYDQTFDVVSQVGSLRDLTLTMPGRHQRENASLAVMTSLLLQDNYPKVTEGVIRAGLAKASWAGRTELLTSNLMIDGAHNQESVAVLVDLLKSQYAGRRIHLLFAAIANKPVTGMLTALSDFSSLAVTTFDYPKALTLVDYPQDYDRIASFQDWLAKVDDSSQDLYVVTGSLYFIAQVRQYVLQQGEN